MSEEEALLAAILADRQDNAPRLVYSDWLEQHGQLERAELIRLLCKGTSGERHDTITKDPGGNGSETLHHLLDAVWVQSLPKGAWGDLQLRNRAEREWQESLSFDDCLLLLDWVEHPERPSGWHPTRDESLPTLLDSASRYAGRAGRRLGNIRITRRLVELLSRPECRHPALEGLIELGDPTAFEALLCCLGDPGNDKHVSIAVAAAATDTEMERLHALINSPCITAELIIEITEIDAEYLAMTNRRLIASMFSGNWAQNE